MIAIGDHFAHVELVLDSTAGRMTAYVLDAEAEKAVRVDHNVLEILILKPESPAGGPPGGDLLTMNAVTNPLTGESVGDTSEFTVVSDLLKGKTEFEGILQSVTIKGDEKKGIRFKFPGGNE